MTDPDQRLKYLLNQYVQKTADSSELQELFLMLEKDWDHLSIEMEASGIDWHKMLDAITVNKSKAKAASRMTILTKSFMRYAALILVVIGLGVWFWYRDSTKAVQANIHESVTANEIAPGCEGAILTLANGSKIVVDSLPNGIIASQNGCQVVLQNGQLAYTLTGDMPAFGSYNTMATPKARQFQIALPDGTKAWLNSASSIRYPTRFSGKKRVVEITGEVYFEVAKNPGLPFTVQVSGGTEILVLGTHFNVNSYTDEEAVKTTLLEGAVQVTSNPVPGGVEPGVSVSLKPGQQAQIRHSDMLTTKIKTGNKIQVHQANIEKVMAWKNGLFNFDNAGVGEVMRQISRWYDIDVVYQNGIPDIYFSGEISRNISLAGLLKGLQKAGVRFRIEDGKKLIVLP